MAEKDAMGVDESNPGDGGLQDHIAHWSEVLDRWVKGIDTGLGRDGEVDDHDGESSAQP